jgi:hypothetical protein
MVLAAVCLSLAASMHVMANADGYGAPRIVTATDDDSVPVVLVSYRAQVEIRGVLAETTVFLSFENRNEWADLEGELEFALPEGATVTGYALDVGDVLVDAVPVEKTTGRIAFESEARKSIDPGLVEWTDGNVFRTMVYPIRAQSRRHIKVEYVSQLDMEAGRGRYTLPMAGLPPLEKLDIEIHACGVPRPPEVLGGPIPEPSFPCVPGTELRSCQT